MHGELLKARCTACGGTMPWHEDLSVEIPCPSCRCSGGLRPHVVWFGEMPLEMDAIYDALLGADLFVAIGTSGSVYPAAASYRRRGDMASAPARSIWSPRITPASSMRDGMGQPARSSQRELSRYSRQDLRATKAGLRLPAHLIRNSRIVTLACGLTRGIVLLSRSTFVGGGHVQPSCPCHLRA
jgi:hypothetical protein